MFLSQILRTLKNVIELAETETVKRILFNFSYIFTRLSQKIAGDFFKKF
jgi:hypothetical protein